MVMPKNHFAYDKELVLSFFAKDKDWHTIGDIVREMRKFKNFSVTSVKRRVEILLEDGLLLHKKIGCDNFYKIADGVKVKYEFSYINKLPEKIRQEAEKYKNKLSLKDVKILEYIARRDWVNGDTCRLKEIQNAVEESYWSVWWTLKKLSKLGLIDCINSFELHVSLPRKDVIAKESIIKIILKFFGKLIHWTKKKIKILWNKIKRKNIKTKESKKPKLTEDEIFEQELNNIRQPFADFTDGNKVIEDEEFGLIEYEEDPEEITIYSSKDESATEIRKKQLLKELRA